MTNNQGASVCPILVDRTTTTQIKTKTNSDGLLSSYYRGNTQLTSTVGTPVQKR